jgi:hypothetical protein
MDIVQNDDTYKNLWPDYVWHLKYHKVIEYWIQINFMKHLALCHLQVLGMKVLSFCTRLQCIEKWTYHMTPELENKFTNIEAHEVWHLNDLGVVDYVAVIYTTELIYVGSRVGRSQVWVSMRTLNSFNLSNPSSRSMALGMTQSLGRATDTWSWQPYCHLWSDCLDNVGSFTSHNPIGFHCLLRG